MVVNPRWEALEIPEKSLQGLYGNETRARRKANAELGKLTTNKYFKSLPIAQIQLILRRYGFNPEPLDGIYTGAEGKTHQKVGKYTWIVVMWYKMPSGNYEITTYLS